MMVGACSQFSGTAHRQASHRTSNWVYLSQPFPSNYHLERLASRRMRHRAHSADCDFGEEPTDRIGGLLRLRFPGKGFLSSSRNENSANPAEGTPLSFFNFPRSP